MFHVPDTAGMTTVGLQHINAAFVQIVDEAPDGAVAFSGCEWNRNLGFESLEDLDVPGDARFLNEEQVVSLDRRCEAE